MLNLFESCTLQLGDRSYYTLQENSVIMSLDDWRRLETVDSFKETPSHGQDLNPAKQPLEPPTDGDSAAAAAAATPTKKARTVSGSSAGAGGGGVAFAVGRKGRGRKLKPSKPKTPAAAAAAAEAAATAAAAQVTRVFQPGEEVFAICASQCKLHGVHRNYAYI